MEVIKMTEPLLPLVCFLSPLLVAILSLLLDPVFRKRRALLVVIGTAIPFVSALLMIPQVIFGGAVLAPPVLAIQVDFKNIAAVVGITLISFLSAIYNTGSERGGRLKPAVYNFFLLFLVSVMLGLTMFYDLFAIFVLIETTIGVSVILVTHSRGKFPMQAAFKYLIITGISAVFVLLGVLIIYELTGTTNIFDIMANPDALSANPRLLLLSVACFIIGLGADIGIAPFHGWVPDVVPASPPAVNSFMCAESIALVFALYQLVYPLYEIYPSSIIIFLMAGTGIFSITLGTLLAYRQDDFMRMVAYASIEEYGYMVLAFGLFTPLSLIAGQIYLLNAALMKMGVLQTLGSVSLRSRTFNMSMLGGLGEKMKKTSWTYILCSLSLVGVPPLSGFFAKWLLYSAVFEFLSWHVGLTASVLAISFLVGISLIPLTFFVRSFHRIFLGKPSEVSKTVSETPLVMWFSAAVSAGVAILVGIQPQLLLSLIETL